VEELDVSAGPSKRLRQEILRGAVRENVELLRGGPPKALRPGRRRVRKSLRALLFLTVGAGLFVSINAISSSRSGPEVIVAKEAPGGTAASSAQLPRPKRVDPAVFRLGVRTIVLDPGHGGADPGSMNAIGVAEKDVTLDVALRLRQLLDEAAFKVEMTRDTDRAMSLKERALFANQRRGDLFVSIHVNALPDVPDRRVVETYYVGAAANPAIEKLAGAENRESGYALSDFRRLLEGVFTDVRQEESRRFAQALQAGLYAGLKKADVGLESRGVKAAPFVVLVATEMPGVLAEVSCISNKEEAARLKDPLHRQSIARALFAGVSAYAEARNHPSEKGS
jgi:N-acetylmuramoyl-L-alanine amidase